MLDIEKEIDVAKQTFVFAKGGSGFAPMARLDCQDGRSVLALIEQDGIAKWETLAELVKQYHVYKVVFMSDSWMRYSTPEEYEYQIAEGLRVHQMPDRHEVFMMTLITADEIAFACYPYHQEGITITWEEPVDFKSGTVESDGVDLVQAALRGD